MRILAIFTLMLSLMAVFSMASMQWHECCNSANIDDSAIESAYEEHRKLNDYPRSIGEFRNIAAYQSMQRCIDRNKELKEIYDAFIRYMPTVSIHDKGQRLSIRGIGIQGADISPMPIHDFSKTGWNSLEAKDAPYRYQKGTFDMEKGSWVLAGGTDATEIFRPMSSSFSHLVPASDYSAFVRRYDILIENAEEVCSSLPGGIGYQSCINEHVLQDRYIKDNIYLYTWAGRTYIQGLLNCENHLGKVIDSGFARISSGTEDKEITADEKDIPESDEWPQISSINVRFNKDSMFIDGKDSIEATFSFIATDESGAKLPYAGRSVWGFGADPESDGLEFQVYPSSGITDSNGQFRVRIELMDADRIIAGQRQGTKVYVYSTKMPIEQRKDHHFILKYGDSISIDSIEVVGDAAWQGSAAILKIKVRDPLNERKIFTIDSSGQYSLPDGSEVDYRGGIRADGRQSEYIAYVTTEKNEVEIGWYAPKLTKEHQISYGKRALSSLSSAAISLLSQKGKDSVSDYKKAVSETEEAIRLRVPSEIARLRNEGRFTLPLDDNEYQKFLNLERLNSNMERFVNYAQLAGEDSITFGNRTAVIITESNQPAYQKINTALKGAFLIEGVIGIAKPDIGIPPGYKIPMQLLSDWYDLVEEMDEIAKDDMMSITVPVTITVEGLESRATDSKTLYVPVKGFKAVLAEEKIW